VTDRTRIDALAAARASVLDRIAAACARVGRDPAEITLVAVSKTVDAGRLRDAVAAGLTVLGENRVQEAADKVAEVPGARWHLVGSLQSNKARRAIEVFDVIQSVDSVSLAARLDRLVREAGPAREGRPGADDGSATDGLPYPILLQVNVDDDPGKTGFAPPDLPGALADVAGLTALEVRGLMTIGRAVRTSEEARPTFEALQSLSERLRATAPLGPDLSMGMSDDFEVAIEEGATIVRVGRALFGERPHDGGRPIDVEAGHTHR
jgi:pyridoxal phosphate enzyme (YggS family)